MLLLLLAKRSKDTVAGAVTIVFGLDALSNVVVVAVVVAVVVIAVVVAVVVAVVTVMYIPHVTTISEETAA